MDSIVGKTTKLKGDFEIEGTLRIDGIFEGSIKGNASIIIGEAGKANMQLEAKDVTIGGKVEGKIKASGKVRILSSGYLKGDITANKIEIDPDAFFSGQCKMLKAS